MSKLVNIGTFCGGLGGILAGGLGVFSFLAGPPSLETPQDLISALGKIEAAVREASLVIDENSSEQVSNALDDFTAQVAIAAQDNSKPFVLKSFSGVVDYPHGKPVDFVAPNNASRLMVFSVNASPDVNVTVDGERVARLKRGENIALDFGNQTCKFELIEMERREYARIRGRCQ